SGERPALGEYLDRYPDLADELRDLIPALVEVEGLGAGSATGSFASRSEIEGPSAVPRRLGDYRILGVIGKGGRGVVYEAERESLQSRVALKMMHEQFRDDPTCLRRFRTEARSAARLHHTNIVPVFDFGDHDGACFYAMQFID